MIRYPNSLETKKARRKCVPEDNKVREETASLLEIHHGIVTLMLWFRVRLDCRVQRCWTQEVPILGC